MSDMEDTDIEKLRNDNRISTEELEDYIQRYEANDVDILTKRMENMASMKPYYAIRDEILKEAKGQGVHTKAFKELIKDRAALRKIAVKPQKLEDVTADEYETMATQMDLFGMLGDARGKSEKADIDALTAERDALQAKVDELLKERDGAEFDAVEKPAAKKPGVKKKVVPKKPAKAKSTGKSVPKRPELKAV